MGDGEMDVGRFAFFSAGLYVVVRVTELRYKNRCVGLVARHGRRTVPERDRAMHQATSMAY